jgi:oligoribonuclease NrnB/cAMP/cGMP phosphodiesterase (DHH superfamily)
MSRPLVVYHANCRDGWCAAWILQHCLGEVELLPANYGDEAPDCYERTVFVVDFSYPREVMEKMNAQARRLLVFDHHKTAEEDCRGARYCIFDQNESGATIAFKWCEEKGYIFGVRDRSFQKGMRLLADYVRDRDLWQWKLDKSAEINAVIRSYPMEFKGWNDMAMKMGANPFMLVDEGRAILRYRERIIEDTAKKATMGFIGGHKVPICQCTTNEIISDVCGKLAWGHPFAATWWEKEDGSRVYSLRSTDKGLDVSEIALMFGGGGHARSAGFTYPGVPFALVERHA